MIGVKAVAFDIGGVLEITPDPRGAGVVSIADKTTTISAIEAWLAA